jgi:sporulation and spore germination protein
MLLQDNRCDNTHRKVLLESHSDNANMKTIQTLLIVVTTIAGLNLPAAAQQRSRSIASPDAVVAALYRQHKKHSPFFQTRDRALVDRYFQKILADLIWKDAINSKGEVGAIDGDPLFNAQDMEITNFGIHKPASRKGLAVVTVSFENFGKKQEIVFLLGSTPSGWKIFDIHYNDGATLLGILKKNVRSEVRSQEVRVYLVAVGDNGRAGKKIGCDDSLVAVTRPIKSTAAPLKAALQELLSTPSQSSGSPKLENFWKGQNLKLTSVSIRGNTATIRISGEVYVAGVCDEPRIEAQIEETARQFPNVKRVNVFIGKRSLAEAIR